MSERQPLNYPVENRFQRVAETKRPDFLANYTEEQFQEMEKKRQILSSLAFFIGKDFKIPVEYNEPGKGWHWDFAKNIIRIDPEDLLHKSDDYIRFVISHEGGHRRISRTDFIPKETWQEPGFSAMMNAIEDPRDNNFVADIYPRFAEQMALAYEEDLGVKEKAEKSAKEKLGFQPRFMQASFEYIQQWFREWQNQPFEIDEHLPAEVKVVVRNTLPSAAQSWKIFPTSEMANGNKPDELGFHGESSIVAHAQASYNINLKKVWPEFKKLVDEDRKDSRVQKMLDEMKKQKGEAGSPEGGTGGLPPELKDKLTPEEQKQLEEAIEKALEQAMKGESEKGEKGEQGAPAGETGETTEGQPAAGKSIVIDLDSLSDGLKKKLKEYFDSLPEEKKKELSDKAEAALKEIEKEFNEQMEGKLTEDPVERAEREAEEEAAGEEKKAAGEKEETDPGKKTKKPPLRKKLTEEQEKALSKYRDIIETQLKTDANAYEKNRREVLPMIDKLEQDLHKIFIKRRESGWQSGFKTGKRVDIKRRIQEKAKSVSVVESKAWQKREMPQEKDYAISLLVDLSGSMCDEKIAETFKATIILAEVLNRLSIKTEILGFNDRLYEYKTFWQDMSKDIRDKMGAMLEEVRSPRAQYNDDGWAVSEASERLAKQAAGQKFLIVLSDGEPAESPAHKGERFDLDNVVEKISKETGQKLIGLGLLSKAVAKHYPQYNIAGISISELNQKLTALLKDVVENYDKF